MKGTEKERGRGLDRCVIGTAVDAQNAGSGLPGTPGTGKKTEYFKASLKTDRKVFADEVIKHDMLSILWKQTVRWRYEVIAFTLLDDQLQLILAKRVEEASSRPSRAVGEQHSLPERDPGQEILEDLRRGCEELYYRSSDARLPALQETSSWKKLENSSDVMRECCDIHQMPVQSGYVDKISKYWWSSYMSYRGKYYWKFLNCRELLDRLSPDPVKACAMFCKEQASYGHRQRLAPAKENS